MLRNLQYLPSSPCLLQWARKQWEWKATATTRTWSRCFPGSRGEHVGSLWPQTCLCLLCCEILHILISSVAEKGLMNKICFRDNTQTVGKTIPCKHWYTNTTLKIQKIKAVWSYSNNNLVVLIDTKQAKPFINRFISSEERNESCKDSIIIIFSHWWDTGRQHSKEKVTR